NEKSALKRKALYRESAVAADRLTPILVRKEEKISAALAQLGYPSYDAFSSELRDADLDELAALADAVLAATDAPYQAALAKLQPAGKPTRADVPRLFRPAPS